MNKVSLFLGMLGILGCVAGGGFITLLRTTVHPAAPPVTPQLPHDGERLLFGNDKGALWVVTLDSGEVRQWEPDSTDAVPYAELQSTPYRFGLREQFYAIAPDGAYARWSLPTAAQTRPYSPYPRFSSYGRQVAAYHRDRTAVYLIDVASAEARLLTRLPALIGVRWSARDGFLLLETMQGQDMATALYTYYYVTADGRDLQPLFTSTGGLSVLSSVQFASDDRWFLYLKSDSADLLPRELYRFDRQRGTATLLYQLDDSTAYIAEVRIAPDTQAIAFTIVAADSNRAPAALWVMGANGEQPIPVYDLPGFGEMQDRIGRYRGYRGCPTSSGRPMDSSWHLPPHNKGIVRGITGTAAGSW